MVFHTVSFLCVAILSLHVFISLFLHIFLLVFSFWCHKILLCLADFLCVHRSLSWLPCHSVTFQPVALHLYEILRKDDGSHKNLIKGGIFNDQTSTKLTEHWRKTYFPPLSFLSCFCLHCSQHSLWLQLNLWQLRNICKKTGISTGENKLPQIILLLPLYFLHLFLKMTEGGEKQHPEGYKDVSQSRGDRP